MKRTAVVTGVAGLILALPMAAQGHVTVQPPEAASESFSRIDVRVPNETDDANTTKVEVEMPDDFYFASYEPVAGWSAEVQKEKLDEPVEIEEGFEATERVTTVTFEADGEGIPPGAFQDFGLSVLIPGEPGDTLTFPALQTYDDGEVVRWVGDPESDEPAATVTVTEGGEDHHAAATEDEGTEHAEGDDADEASADDGDDDGSDGMTIAALALGGVGFLMGGISLARTRKG